ncbi:Urease subunit alpha [Baekduia alba]|uniref:urease subunit gamma n=1 Tax=Baekduia alba TaxID=2997333 RepID=UPI002340D8C1|nr:urease subunit gamma [Baekduia alba]WCB93176.1 Urease subunit alpha [Baekduia alba]
MRLLPQEQDRLLLFLAAELARARRARGLRLNQAEATAIVADGICELARDGLRYADVVAGAYAILGEDDVLDGVRALVRRIEVEAVFRDGRHLVVVEDPLGPAPRAGDDAEPAAPWLDSATTRLLVVNEGAVLIGVTSHLHFFETNPMLHFDRAAAWGLRLAVPARTKIFFPPGEGREVALVPIGGARVVRGHGELVDGALDDPAIRDAALAAAREKGYRGAEARPARGGADAEGGGGRA